MSCKSLSILLATLCLTLPARSEEIPAAAPKVRVTGDRVSLRSEPDLNAELLDRAMRGEELTKLGETNGWVAVQAPDSLDFWVASEFLENGIVVPDRLNIRSGPSQNYSVVHVAERGETLSLRGEFNGWNKIAPPIGSRVWISAEYTELVIPPRPEPQPEPEPVEQPQPEPEPVEQPQPEPESVKHPAAESTIPPLTDAEKKPLELVLDPTKSQGIPDEIPGILRRSHPGLFKLILTIDGREEPICLVRGNEQQMERYLNRFLLIKGKKYYAKGVVLPVLRVEKIHLDPILRD